MKPLGRRARRPESSRTRPVELIKNGIVYDLWELSLNPEHVLVKGMLGNLNVETALKRSWIVKIID